MGARQAAYTVWISANLQCVYLDMCIIFQLDNVGWPLS